MSYEYKSSASGQKYSAIAKRTSQTLKWTDEEYPNVMIFSVRMSVGLSVCRSVRPSAVRRAVR